MSFFNYQSFTFSFHLFKITEITEKDTVLNEMNTILSASAKTRKQEADKSVRQVDLLRKQLKEEKRLKQSALQKIDDIMSQVSRFFQIISLRIPSQNIFS